jgi:hypothetical protein
MTNQPASPQYVITKEDYLHKVRTSVHSIHASKTGQQTVAHYVGVAVHLCNLRLHFSIFPQSIHDCHSELLLIKISFYDMQLEKKSRKEQSNNGFITILNNIPTIIFQQLGTASHILLKHVPKGYIHQAHYNVTVLLKSDVNTIHHQIHFQDSLKNYVNCFLFFINILRQHGVTVERMQ